MARLESELIARTIQYLRLGSWAMASVALEAARERLTANDKLAPAIEAFNAKDFMRCVDLLEGLQKPLNLAERSL